MYTRTHARTHARTHTHVHIHTSLKQKIILVVSKNRERQNKQENIVFLMLVQSQFYTNNT